MSSTATYDSVLCNLCGADDPDVLLPALNGSQERQYAASGESPLRDRLVRCRRCGLVYVSPRPPQSNIEHAYEDVDNSVYLAQGHERQQTFGRAIRWLESLGIRKGRVLDIGCAGGFFIKAAQDAGWEATGIELSRHLAEYGRNNLGVNIVQGTLEHATFPEHSFDLITIWDVLEHVTDPADVLRRAHRLLKPGGTLLLNYPDYSSVWARLLGRKWWFLIDVHIYYFTPKTISKLLEKCGFIANRHRMYFQTLRLGYLTERLRGLSAALGGPISGLCRLLRLQNIPITYYASQTTTLAKPHGPQK